MHRLKTNDQKPETKNQQPDTRNQKPETRNQKPTTNNRKPNMRIPIVNHSLKYNPSLDGLRGIAIILVLLFHIWPTYFSFGYVGVDIFFVLSGYLITQIIYTKLQSHTFSFAEFYRNRIRRIFPAVIIVLLTTMLIGYLFLFPSELAQLGMHVKSSAFFYENFRLIHEVGYWDKAAQLKPLLHFWSLSIEEQFYLVWPLLIFASYKLRFNLFTTMLSIFFILFIIPYIIDINSFYHPLSRFWELAFGGLIYALSLRYDLDSILQKYRPWLWLAFLGAMALCWENNSYNALTTLLITFATGLLILSIQRKNDILLSSTPLVVLGLISFPLYLWHYVLISFLHIFGLVVPTYGVLIIFVSILLSYLTYRYIELYARQQKSYLFASVLFTAMLLVGFLGQYIYKHHGLPQRSHLMDNDKYKKQFIRTPATNQAGLSLVHTILGHKSANNYVKSTSSDLSKKFIAVIGDSHAHTSYPGFAEAFKKRGYETLLLANSSCPPYIRGVMGKSAKQLNHCEKQIEDIYTVLQKIPHLHKIVMATRGPVYMYDIGYGVVDSGGKPLHYHFKDFFASPEHYDQKKKFFDVLESTFNYFNRQNLDFYYLLEDPELGFSPKNCMERPFDIFPTECKISYTAYIKRAGEYRKSVQKSAEQYPNVHLLDPKDFYCDHSYCYAVKNGKMLYADDDHHSVDGSQEQAKFLISQILGNKISDQ